MAVTPDQLDLSFEDELWWLLTFPPRWSAAENARAQAEMGPGFSMAEIYRLVFTNLPPEQVLDDYWRRPEGAPMPKLEPPWPAGEEPEAIYMVDWQYEDHAGGRWFYSESDAFTAAKGHDGPATVTKTVLWRGTYVGVARSAPM